MYLRIRGYTNAPAVDVPKIVRSRMLKSLAHTIEPFSRVLVPYLHNRASRVLLDFLEEVKYPQYIAIVSDEEVDGRPTYIYNDPLEILIRGANYPVYRPLDASEIAYMRLRFSPKSPVFHGIFPFRRVHPRELGVYLKVKNMRFPRKQRPGEERRLTLKLEASYPRLSISAAAFVEKISRVFMKHIRSDPVQIEPKERRLVGI